MPTKQLIAAGRVLMAVLFLVSGIRKAMAFAGTVGYFAKLGIPFAEVVVPLVILLELGGAIALVIGWRITWVAGALGLYSIAAGLLAHQFWAVEPAQFANQLFNMLKNVGLAGGFLIVAALAREQRSD